MDIVVIDIETYYDKEYSLSKMTTESYVRDPRFEVIGVGVKINNHPTDWYTGGNPGRFLRSLDYTDKAILCHNTAFDGAILSWHFGIRPRLWLDTLSMARPFHQLTVGGSLAKLAAYYGLGKKGDEVVAAMGKRRADFTPEEIGRYGMYCINDVDLTRQLFDKLKRGFPASELLVIDQTLRMYTEPVIELDVPLLQQHLEEVRARKAALLDEVDVGIDDIMSNPKFAAVLQRLGAEPPTKTSPTTGKETWAFAKTDKGMTDLLEHPDPAVQALVATRLGVKSTIEETRTEALIGVASRGKLPIMLNYYGAHTGRFCLTADTCITVLRDGVVLDILIPELLPDDLVWDGEEFVTHGGLLDQGEREVMSYDGITGTPDHRVFCEEVEGTVELRDACQRGYTVKVAGPAPRHWTNTVDTA
jgi:DNA polymerase